MAPAPSRCRMGAYETTPPTTPREPTPQSQPLPPQPAGSSWPPMIGRRYPASSSLVLAGALPGARLRALQLDPGHAPARTGSSKETTRTGTTQPDEHRELTGPIHHAHLTTASLMGAETLVGGTGIEPVTSSVSGMVGRGLAVASRRWTCR